MKYEYKCKACQFHTVIEQSMKDDAIKHCPECGEEAFYRVISSNPFILKGSGWASYEKSGRYHDK